MRAVVLDGPGPPEALRIRDVPIPIEQHGWVRIRVEAFGLNRSELHTRLGLGKASRSRASPASNAPALSTSPQAPT